MWEVVEGPGLGLRIFDDYVNIVYVGIDLFVRSVDELYKGSPFYRRNSAEISLRSLMRLSLVSLVFSLSTLS